jgi:hypothetical protein
MEGKQEKERNEILSKGGKEVSKEINNKDNVFVNTSPRIGPRYATRTSSLQTVISVGSVQSVYKGIEFRSNLVQSSCESVGGRTLPGKFEVKKN